MARSDHLAATRELVNLLASPSGGGPFALAPHRADARTEVSNLPDHEQSPGDCAAFAACIAGRMSQSCNTLGILPSF